MGPRRLLHLKYLCVEQKIFAERKEVQTFVTQVYHLKKDCLLQDNVGSHESSVETNRT